MSGNDKAEPSTPRKADQGDGTPALLLQDPTQFFDLPLERGSGLEGFQNAPVGSQFVRDRCHFSRCARTTMNHGDLEGWGSVDSKSLVRHSRHFTLVGLSVEDGAEKGSQLGIRPLGIQMAGADRPVRRAWREVWEKRVDEATTDHTPSMRKPKERSGSVRQTMGASPGSCNLLEDSRRERQDAANRRPQVMRQTLKQVGARDHLGLKHPCHAIKQG